MKDDQLMTYLLYLKLSFFREYHQAMAKEAVEKNWTQLDFLSRLVEGETLRRKDRATQSRIQAARFPILKTLEQFNWTWPKKINRPQVQNLFRLSFIKEKGNVIFLGGVGLGKSHLATALAYEGCLSGHTTLFTTAIDIVNTLAAAQSTNRLKSELKKYLSPKILCVDELGYLPIDKTGADLLFQVFSQRYETGSTIVTTNQAYKHWAKIFNNDPTLIRIVGPPVAPRRNGDHRRKIVPHEGSDRGALKEKIKNRRPVEKSTGLFSPRHQIENRLSFSKRPFCAIFPAPATLKNR
jgi:DNA replication protein DnaC